MKSSINHLFVKNARIITANALVEGSLMVQHGKIIEVGKLVCPLDLPDDDWHGD